MVDRSNDAAELLHSIRYPATTPTLEMCQTWQKELQICIEGGYAPDEDGVLRATLCRVGGLAHYLRGEFSTVVAKTVEARELYGPLAHAADLGRTDLLEGNAQYALGELEAALRCYESATTHFKCANDSDGAGRALGNMGNVYLAQGNYTHALSMYQQAYDVHTASGDTEGMARAIGGMGLVSASRADYASATEQLTRSAELWHSIGNTREEARMYGGLANVYRQVGEFAAALEHLAQVQAIVEGAKDSVGLAKVLLNIAGVYEDMHEHARRLDVTEHAARVNSTTSDVMTRVRVVASRAGALADLGRNEEALIYADQAREESRRLGLRAMYASNTRLRATILTALKRHDEAEAAAKEALEECAMADIPTEKIAALQALGALYRHSQRVDEATEALRSALSVTQERGERAHEVEVLESLSELIEHRDPREALSMVRRASALRSELLGERQRHHLAVLEMQQRLSEEHKLAEQHRALLLSMMPDEVVARILRGEEVIADTYDNVSVLFLDIVGFTELASDVSAGHLVHALNGVFEQCDRVCDSYELTKIKTIGDAYLAISGLPVQQEDNVQRVASAALELVDSLQRLHNATQDGRPLSVRVGLHCGPVVAGVIGTKRAQFDIWGDTVNVASRLEGSCLPGRIHVSEAFASQLADGITPHLEGTDVVLRKAPYLLRLRGTVEVKGKGEMRTWWLENA